MYAKYRNITIYFSKLIAIYFTLIYSYFFNIDEPPVLPYHWSATNNFSTLTPLARNVGISEKYVDKGINILLSSAAAQEAGQLMLPARRLTINRLPSNFNQGGGASTPNN